MASARDEHHHTSRLTSFSDGVFAIAITLLVLNLKITETPGLLQQLVAQWDDILSFAVSFFIIGAAWIAHHRLFQHARRYDDTVLWLNTAFLFWIGLFPFLTLAISEHPTSQVGAFLYGSSMTFASATFWGLWKLMERRKYLDPRMDPDEIRKHKRRAAFGTAIFVVSTGTVFLSVPIARTLWGVAIAGFLVSDFAYKALSVVRSD